MFGFIKKKTESELVAAYKKDNETLMAKIYALIDRRDEEAKNSDRFQNKLKEANEKIIELESQIEELKADSSVKVTYAQARKTMTKAKLKDMRKALEAVPSNAGGFSGTVSVYDKKTKRLKVVTLTSKDQALEIVSKAEKGHVDIVI